MNKFFKWLVSWFKKKGTKPQTVAEMANTVISIGRGNSTTVSQVRVLKGRDPELNYEYKFEPLSELEVRDISRKAVEDIAAQKLVTKARDKIRQEQQSKRPPTPPPIPARRTVYDDDRLARANRNNDDDIMSTVAVATMYSSMSDSSYHSNSSSHDSSSYDSGSCDSSSSSSCD